MIVQGRGYVGAVTLDALAFYARGGVLEGLAEPGNGIGVGLHSPALEPLPQRLVELGDGDVDAGAEGILSQEADEHPEGSGYGFGNFKVHPVLFPVEEEQWDHGSNGRVLLTFGL
jgi:hypothetical protein